MTMPWIRTSAPGKLFLLGEYAVLEGAPALLSAVDRRVSVTIDQSSSWQISAPNLGIDTLTLGEDGRLPAGLDTRTRRQLRIYDAVREAVLARAPRSCPPLSISIDSGELFLDGHKLGLGSSAAVAGALTAGLARARGLELDQVVVFQLAHAAHRSAQGGAGSGGDVATSVYGGLILYSIGTDPLQMCWPEGLSIMAVVTGEGSETARLVGRVADYAARDEAQYSVDMARLAQLAASAEHALGDPSSFLRLATDYFEALAALDAHARAGIVSERHHLLNVLAKREGGAFKTSGAGGDDVGLTFSYSGEPTERLAAALAQAGASVVPLGFGADGLQGGSTS